MPQLFSVQLRCRHILQLEVTIHGVSPRAENPTNNAPPNKKQPKEMHIAWKLPTVVRPYSRSLSTLPALKAWLFDLANELDSSIANSNPKAILTAADCNNSLIISVYIASHEQYAKSKNCKVTNDSELESFLVAVLLAPKKVSGVTLAMEDPGKVAREKALVRTYYLLTCSKLMIGSNYEQVFARTLHGRVAENLLQGKGTTSSELAHLTPLDPAQEAMTELLTKYGSRVSNTKEGYRIYNRDKVTEVMQRNWEHFLLWSQEIVSVF